ncbi:hypothetical protein Rhe02_33650 [Rhizocola hellebori]|uniref:Uncharacterized protein n=1 Tax=Rhizocola hellebori TaxID=1392758 RepID=A0A8J3Q751_9ACTN|nr:hypothetical protein [Rhizocola hellebori]GIH05298.1 hypothetical protein Rhe02_33650 [Rhizocola hellebori]
MFGDLELHRGFQPDPRPLHFAFGMHTKQFQERQVHRIPGVGWPVELWQPDGQTEGLEHRRQMKQLITVEGALELSNNDGFESAA